VSIVIAEIALIAPSISGSGVKVGIWVIPRLKRRHNNDLREERPWPLSGVGCNSSLGSSWSARNVEEVDDEGESLDESESNGGRSRATIGSKGERGVGLGHGLYNGELVFVEGGVVEGAEGFIVRRGSMVIEAESAQGNRGLAASFIRSVASASVVGGLVGSIGNCKIWNDKYLSRLRAPSSIKYLANAFSILKSVVHTIFSITCNTLKVDGIVRSNEQLFTVK
jgi:hypothetical protein